MEIRNGLHGDGLCYYFAAGLLLVSKIGAFLLLGLLGRDGGRRTPDAGGLDRFLKVGLRRVSKPQPVLAFWLIATANTGPLTILVAFLHLRGSELGLLRLCVGLLHIFLLLFQLDVVFKLLDECLLRGLAQVEPLGEYLRHHLGVLSVSHD